ncbi:MAG TPA: nucleoside recognition domain-containing protein [Candidatus Limnocylindrales bacterium]|nr:nucleoside recognition domain-containing protein [Candidatus Limnocylindrales bacterium]
MENTSPPNNSTILTPAWKGTVKALRTVLLLAKIIIPVTFVLVTLDKLGWLVTMAAFFGPALKIFGLPGEAALPLLLGFFVNIYASLGAIAVLSFSAREITIIALMILTCHSLLMESPILKFTGLRPVSSVLLRLAGAFFFGFLLNLAYLAIGG